MRNERLYNLLKSGKRITRADWRRISGSYKLPARISELRRDMEDGKISGWIGDETIKLKGGKRCKKYFYLIRQPLIG